ncbi:MAG: Uma2 family endonuclease [Chloroflexota bacterium]|nr:Uma2 family endonuclease [Chloroflexota bacterium]MDE2909803.1 Uma2 family endonuclease [Chloroflexota bacterium]
MVLEKQFVSADMFLEYVEQIDDRIVELVEGVIVDMSRPGGEHGEILSLIHAKIAVHVYENDLGRLVIGDTGFLLERREDGKDTVRGLDLAFISNTTSSERLSTGWITFAPDLAVEVISPGNKASDIEKKIEQLLEAGTTLIWIVYPDLQRIVVHTIDGMFKLKESDLLTGGDVLPGFEIRVADIFPA